MKDYKHFIRKLISTIRVITCLGLARTFGQYQHSIYDPSGVDFALYIWKGRRWAIPAGAIKEDEDQ